MAEIGQIARGTVVRVLPYGALVRLDDGLLGLVHISEIDARFVRDVAEYLEPEGRVVVKVIAQKECGKLEFSIKQAKGTRADLDEAPLPDDFETPAEPQQPMHHPDTFRREPRAAFDEKMREFMVDSTERLGDIRRHHDTKLGNHRRR